MVVIKRDGTRVPYDETVIQNAVQKAIDNVGKLSIEKIHGLDALDIAQAVTYKIKDLSEVEVETIQDTVIFILMGTSYKEVAKHYTEYRHQRNRDRKMLISTFASIVKNGDNENANKPSDRLNVKRDLIAGEYYRYCTLKSLPSELLDAHQSGAVHLHDTDFIGDGRTTNCCVPNIEDMLRNGTRVNNAQIETPKSLLTATTILNQIIASIAMSQYGGVSVGEFNELLAVYAKKTFTKNIKIFCEAFSLPINDYVISLSGSSTDIETQYTKAYALAKSKTKKDIYDAMQTFEYQSNSISSASQTPFVTITFTIPTSWESEQIILSYLDVRMAGLGKEKRIAIFPKLSMIVVDGYNLNPQDPYYYLLEKASVCISKTFYPDILHYSKEDYLKGKTFARMGCRSRVAHDWEGELQKHGRFNIGVHTHNLVQPALKAIKDKTGIVGFFENLEESSKLVEQMIVWRFNHMRTMKAKESPILFVDGAIGRYEGETVLEDLFRTGQGSISYGFIGLDDCVRVLTGDSIDKQKDLAHSIMSYIRNRVDFIKIKHGIPCSLYGTPAEALVSTAFKKDYKLYKDVMPEWLLERKYYTNSYHYASELNIDAFSKLSLESEFVNYCNGGNINYSELGNIKHNPQAIIELIQYAHTLPIEYQGFNISADTCYQCGYDGDMAYDNQYYCPKCGNRDKSKLNVIKRLCGYLGNLQERAPAEGRVLEINNRVNHV